MIVTIILSILLLLLLVLSCSVYIQLRPPESVALVALRMPYQIGAAYVTIGSMIGITVYFTVVILKGLKPERYSLVLAVGFFICCVMGIIYSLRITSAKAFVSGLEYGPAENGSIRYEIKEEDLRERTGMVQCNVVTPLDSSHAGYCVVFLNYGGWSAQDDKMGGYLQELFVNAGYSYVSFAGIGKEQGVISAIVSDVKRGLHSLIEEKHYEKIVLAGCSAGGSIAMIIAFSSEQQNVYGKSFPVDGVIALYPMTDTGSAYDYFVNVPETRSWLGTLGDRLYCRLYGDSGGAGTFAGEAKLLNEATFGVRGAKDSLYKQSTFVNLVGEQNIPTLMIGGSADSMTVVEDTRELYRCMANKGLDCAYLELPSVEHAFDLIENSARKRACVEMKNWITAVMP